jgi:hypothetical protein
MRHRLFRRAHGVLARPGETTAHNDFANSLAPRLPVPPAAWHWFNREMPKCSGGHIFGSRVFVCDNLAFIADHVIKRKHTANLKRDLPGIVGELVEPLALHREAQAKPLTRYRQTVLSDERADHAILNLYREGVINIQRVPDVMAQFADPQHEEWEDHTAWTLFNAVTFALNGRVIENSQATPKLHRIIDGVRGGVSCLGPLSHSACGRPSCAATTGTTVTPTATGQPSTGGRTAPN